MQLIIHHDHLQTIVTFGQSSETRDLSIHLLDRFLMECLKRNPKALANINVTLYGATTSMVVASKLLEPQHISYVLHLTDHNFLVDAVV